MIKQKMPDCSTSGKALILTAFIKMSKNSPEIVPLAREVFQAHSTHWNVEI